MKVGIIGAGHIAEKMALTLRMIRESGRDASICSYAIASRDQAKADVFAREWGFQKSYGSYKALAEDPEVDLIYVATPHSHHFAHASLCIEAGKPVLCEKAFTANAREAGELLDLAHKHGVFITEALWTRYMPISHKVKQLLDSGIVGEPLMASAALCYPMTTKERILRPELCGGALLDLGVYCINFARMYLGTDIEQVSSQCIKGATGVDMQETIELRFAGGRSASLLSSALCRCDRHGLLFCSEGYIKLQNVNIPQRIKVYKNDELIEVCTDPDFLTGYEYEVLACRDALSAGLVESSYMPHQETLEIMKMMDSLRAQWGVRYPMD